MSIRGKQIAKKTITEENLNLTLLEVNGISNNAIVVDIKGVNGQLFTITDSLVGDIFTVSDISGIPILNVNTNEIVTITGDLDVTNGITTNYTKYTSTNVPTLTDGMRRLNSVIGTTEMKIVGHDATLQDGFEVYGFGHNATATTIPNGAVITVTGIMGEYPTIEPAIATNSVNIKYRVFGVMTEPVLPGEWGIFTKIGEVHDLDLSAFNVGDDLFLSQTTPGGFITGTDINISGRRCQVGVVLSNSSTSGIISLNIQNEFGVSDNTALAINTFTVNDTSTGVYYFEGLSIIDSTHFNVGAAKGWIVDNESNPLKPTVTYVEFSGSTYTDDFLTTQYLTHIMLNKNGTISQLASPLTPRQKREHIHLGNIGHPDKTAITIAMNTTDMMLSPLSQLRDMFTPIPLINDSVVAFSNTSLSISNSEGYVYGLGINPTDLYSPNRIYIASSNGLSFKYRMRAGGIDTNYTLLDPLHYDNGTSTPVAIANTNTHATNQRLYLLANGTFRVQYGQTLYTKDSNISALTVASLGILSEPFITFPPFKTEGVLIAIISIVANATNLSDPLQAKILLASKFGEITAGAGAGTGGSETQTLQITYDNSTPPQIVTSALHKALTIQIGSGSDTDNAIEVTNTNGDIVASIDGLGNITSTTTNNISTSISQRVSVDNILSNSLSTEISARISGDNILSNSISTQSSTSISSMSTYLPLSAITDSKGISGFIDGNNISVSYDWTTRNITLNGADLSYYWLGVKKTLGNGLTWTTPTPHDNVVGPWFLKSSDGTTFGWAQQPWVFSDVMVAYVNFQATSATSFAIKECHGLMDWKSHEEFHTSVGTYIKSGGKLTAGTYVENLDSDAANTPGFDAAVVKDEDCETNIAVWTEGTYTTMYVNATTLTSTFDVNSPRPFRVGTSYMQVNNILTGAMSTGAANRWFNVYQILVPTSVDLESAKYRMIMLQPQSTFTSLVSAQAEDPKSLSLGALSSLSAEFIIYARITYSTNSAFNNVGRCSIATNGITYVIGNKMTQVSVAGIVGTNHAALSNLTWLVAGHIGTSNTIPAFDVSGNATEIQTSTIATSTDISQRISVDNILSSSLSSEVSVRLSGDVSLSNSLSTEISTRAATVGIIGAAEDNSGLYTDGIFKDFVSTTPIGTAIDRFNEMFLLLAPPEPLDNWGSKLTNLRITSTLYQTGYALTTGTSVANITLVTTPTYTLTSTVGLTTLAVGLPKTGSRIFTMTDNSVDLEVETILPASTGDQNGIIKYTVGDPYLGVAGAGFWVKCVTAFSAGSSLAAITPSATQRTMSFTYPNSGSLSYSYYIDSVTLPVSISTPTITLPTMTAKVSGVLTLSSNQQVTGLGFIISNAVSYFYNNSLWDISGSLAESVPNNAPTSPPTTAYQTVTLASKTLNVKNGIGASGVFSDTSWGFTITARNIAAAAGGTNVGSVNYSSSALRVDTVSNESTRLISGSGSYPATGYGTTYDSTKSLIVDYLDELQLRNGLYVYPTVNYSLNSLGGPDYSTATGTRWVTFKFDNYLAGKVGFDLDLGTTNFTGLIGEVGIKIEVKVDGTSPSKWINGNVDYVVGTNPGDPSGSDGVAAASYISATKRRLTFGSLSKTGTVYVRIGIMDTSKTKYIKTVSLSNPS